MLIEEFFTQLDEDLFIEELSILSVLRTENCLGRRALASRTGLSERRVREAINRLLDKRFLIKNNDLCINRDKISFFTQLNISSLEINNYVLTIACCFDNDLLETVRKRITDLRDHMVILTGKPWVFEIIGIHDKGEIILPKVPRRIVSEYKRFISRELDNGSIIVLWNEYKPFVNESILLHGLLNLCISNR